VATAVLSVDAEGREALLGFIDKLFQHLANIAVGLSGEEDAIALEAKALGFGIAGGGALCHAIWLPAGHGPRHLRAIA
jgi:hypothetical protein